MLVWAELYSALPLHGRRAAMTAKEDDTVPRWRHEAILRELATVHADTRSLRLLHASFAEASKDILIQLDSLRAVVESLVEASASASASAPQSQGHPTHDMHASSRAREARQHP